MKNQVSNKLSYPKFFEFLENPPTDSSTEHLGINWGKTDLIEDLSFLWKPWMKINEIYWMKKLWLGLSNIQYYYFWTLYPYRGQGGGSRVYFSECMVHHHLGVQDFAQVTSSALLWRCPGTYPLLPEHFPSFVCIGAWAALNLLQTTTPYWYPNDDISGKL